MKISIITVCYNSGKTLPRTMKSVLTQKDVEVEYIIVDGKSSDNSVDIIKEFAGTYPGKIKWISEPDQGIYDAMNKGIDTASGEIIGILNSDDCYTDDSVLASVESVFNEKKTDSVYGDLIYLKNSKPFRYWKAGSRSSFKSGWMPPHPSFFVKKEIYYRFGSFRLDCGTSADYELMLRFMYTHRISSGYIRKVLVYMNSGGASNNGVQSRLNAYKSDYKALEINGLRNKHFILFLKKIRKIPQLFTPKLKIVKNK